MRRILSVVTILAVWFILTGVRAGEAPAPAKRTHKELAKELLDKLTKLADVLKTVKDEESAKAAAPKITTLGKELSETVKQAKEVGQPTTQVSKEIEDEFGKQAQQVIQSLDAEGKRISGDPKLAEAKKALDEVEKSMGQ